MNATLITSILDAKQPESDVLDYKEIIWDKTGKEGWRIELSKDVTALANSNGGLIIVGVKENETVPVSLVGVDAISESTVQRLYQTIRKNTDPPVYVKIHCLEVENKNVVVVEVPMSSSAPHMVTAGGCNVFVRRSGPHNVSMNSAEIVAKVNSGRSVMERAAEAHQEFMSKFTISQRNARFILSLCALPLDEHKLDFWDIDQFLPFESHCIPLLNSHSIDARHVFAGVRNTSRSGHTSLFDRFGSIYATVFFKPTKLSDGSESCVLAADWLRKKLAISLEQMAKWQELHSATWPVVACATMNGSAGWFLHGGENEITEDVLDFPPLYIEDIHDEHFDEVHMIAPWLHMLWNAAGTKRCPAITEDGARSSRW